MITVNYAAGHSFYASDFAETEGISVSTARRRLEKLEWDGRVSSQTFTEENPLKYAALDYGSMPPIRRRLYKFIVAA